MCIYYKKLWANCKKLHNNKLIYAFWTLKGSIKLKVPKNGNIHVITHNADLEELFRNNDLIKNMQRVQVLFIQVAFFSQLVDCVQCSTLSNFRWNIYR